MTDETNEQTPGFSDRINAKIAQMRAEGRTKFEIMAAIDADIMNIWNDKNNYVEFTVTLPAEIYREQIKILKSCREAIGFFEHQCDACGKCNRSDNEAENENIELTDAEVFGNLIIEGTNALLSRHSKKMAEMETKAAMEEFLSTIGKNGVDPEQLSKLFDGSKSQKIIVDSVNEIGCGLQDILNEMGEKGFEQFAEDHKAPAGNGCENNETEEAEEKTEE